MTSHAEAVVEKSANMLPLVDMYDEASSAPLPCLVLPPPPPWPARGMADSRKRSSSKLSTKVAANRPQVEEHHSPFLQVIEQSQHSGFHSSADPNYTMSNL